MLILLQDNNIAIPNTVRNSFVIIIKEGKQLVNKDKQLCYLRALHVRWDMLKPLRILKAFWAVILLSFLREIESPQLDTV
jgi:hypothetical protein